LTLAQFLKDFKAKEGLEVSMLSYGRSLLYAEFLPKKRMADRLTMTLVDLVKQVSTRHDC
jgi:ubiquitin-activating enzyme E1